MEAPEKLYISHCKDYSEERIFVAYPEREFSEDIEYTRTDAFIEKADKWLKENVENYYYLDEAYDKVISTKRLSEDFRQHMKGQSYDTRSFTKTFK